MRRLPPLNALKAFEAAARRGGFSRAAEELGVSQSAVSRHVKNLELYLGHPLFLRQHQSLQLTNHGTLLCLELTEIFDRLEQATARMTDKVSVLTVRSPPTFAMRWLVPRLGAFQQQWPDVSVRVSTTDKVFDLEAGGFDAAVVCVDSLKEGRDVVSIELLREELLPVCAPRYVERHGLKNPADLGAVTLLHGAADGFHWRRWLEINGVERRGKGNLMFDTMDMAIGAAIGGQGVALANPDYLQEELSSGRLVLPLGRGRARPCTSAYHLLYTRRAERQEGLRAFRDWLLASVGEEATQSTPTGGSLVA